MIKTVIDQMELVEASFASTNFFIFGEISDINSEDRSKTYPGILVNGQGVGVGPGNQLVKGLIPKNQQFNLRVFFFDTYPDSEQQTTDLQSKYNDLLITAVQYFKKLTARSIDDSDLLYNMTNITGGLFARNQHNDQLVQLSFDLTFTAKTICTDGVFDQVATACSLLLSRLTTAEKNECILPNYDYYDTNVTDNHTAEQVTDLKEVYCAPRSYAFPHTSGQDASYRTGDDKWVQDNIFPNVLAEGTVTSLADFTTLKANNIFGNTDRFTDQDGGQAYADDYVIDHFTGMGIVRVAQPDLIWNDAIDNALSANVAGFDDYFLPDRVQKQTIARINVKSGFSVLDYPPLNLDPANTFWWTSSTHWTNSSIAYHLSRDGRLIYEKKSNARPSLLFRKHF